MSIVRVGIVGAGAIGLAYAALIAETGHRVSIWSPRSSADALRQQPLSATGALDVTVSVLCVTSAEELAIASDVLVIAVPINGHKRVMDELLPHLRPGQTIIVSSMGSLSSLYLFEAAASRGLDIRVASFGTTVMTARRKHAAQVNVMTRRAVVPVSCLPSCELPAAVDVCRVLFGDVFTQEENPLVTTLANSNPISHVPLALFNWTRIERAEEWPQYYYMTPRVSRVIELLDAERLTVANAFGVKVAGISQHMSRSFKVDQCSLADIAAELHRRRGGPPGPVDVETRYLCEDVPFGLVFLHALGTMARVPTPVTDAMIAVSTLVSGEQFADSNELIFGLGLPSESVDGLLARVGGSGRR